MDNDVFKKWDTQIDPRIDSLRRDGYHLEAFYLFSNTVEFVLRGSIMLQESWISTIVKKSNLNFCRTKMEDLDKKTLGDLIKLFAKYTNDNTLVDRLNNFNSFRVKIIHKILKNDIIKLNTEASTLYVTYNQIVSNICRYNMTLIEKEIKRANRKSKLKKD